MKKYYLNRELARKLDVPLAKWKRWSREFLPPDPIGGYRSGFARHFRIRDAFLVFLGGHLVSDLRFTIAEARTILADLDPWLRGEGLPGGDRHGPRAAGDVEVRIRPVRGEGGSAPRFRYALWEREAGGGAATGREEALPYATVRHRVTPVGEPGEAAGSGDRPPTGQVLMLSGVIAWFLERLEGRPAGKGGGSATP
jgi:hypothetical protein